MLVEAKALAASPSLKLQRSCSRREAAELEQQNGMHSLLLGPEFSSPKATRLMRARRPSTGGLRSTSVLRLGTTVYALGLPDGEGVHQVPAAYVASSGYRRWRTAQPSCRTSRAAPAILRRRGWSRPPSLLGEMRRTFHRWSEFSSAIGTRGRRFFPCRSIRNFVRSPQTGVRPNTSIAGSRDRWQPH